MFAYLRYALFALLAVAFVIVALANRAVVEIKLLPEALAQLFNFNAAVSLPLFLILGGAIAVGLLLGIIWEWLREHSLRAEAARLRRENAATRDELEQVAKLSPKARRDDVLALVETK